MKKRILSCLMALALCLTLLPTAALAEEPEGTAQTSPAVEEAADPENGKAKQENQPAAPGAGGPVHGTGRTAGGLCHKAGRGRGRRAGDDRRSA